MKTTGLLISLGLLMLSGCDHNDEKTESAQEVSPNPATKQTPTESQPRTKAEEEIQALRREVEALRRERGAIRPTSVQRRDIPTVKSDMATAKSNEKVLTGKYQERAEDAAWQWSEEAVKLSFYERGNKGKYRINHETVKGDLTRLNIIISEEAGKQVFEIKGHECTPLIIDGDVLYYASYDTSVEECALIAVNLATKQQLWKTELRATGIHNHSDWINHINLGLADDVLIVFGIDGNQKYIEIVDVKSGDTVGHKIFNESVER